MEPFFFYIYKTLMGLKPSSAHDNSSRERSSARDGRRQPTPASTLARLSLHLHVVRIKEHTSASLCEAIQRKKWFLVGLCPKGGEGSCQNLNVSRYFSPGLAPRPRRVMILMCLCVCICMSPLPQEAWTLRYLLDTLDL